MNIKSFLNSVDPELYLSKNGGVWYLLGAPERFDPYVERCLHVVRKSDITLDILESKIEDLRCIS